MASAFESQKNPITVFLIFMHGKSLFYYQNQQKML